MKTALSCIHTYRDVCLCVCAHVCVTCVRLCDNVSATSLPMQTSAWTSPLSVCSSLSLSLSFFLSLSLTHTHSCFALPPSLFLRYLLTRSLARSLPRSRFLSLLITHSLFLFPTLFLPPLHIHIYIYMCICMYIKTCTYKHVHIHACTYIYIYMHVHININIHTHAGKREQRARASNHSRISGNA